MPDEPSHPSTLAVRPWPDPVIDAVGHDLRSTYVERFWLPVIGPSCTLLLRQLAQRFEAEPEGFDLDVAACARSLGLGAGLGRQAPLGRTITRCCQFGAAQRFGAAGLVVRRKLPTMARHQLARLPEALQVEHSRRLGLAGPALRAPAETSPAGSGGAGRRGLAAAAAPLGPGGPPRPGPPARPGGWAVGDDAA